jgi:S-adenosyl-L-methionine hydrolase (adenosine-forming)
MSRAIALMTDFGTSDIYVGVMKGVIQSIYPQAALIDISHHIQPQHVRQAAFALLNAYHYFAPGTLFLVIVDPGVGSTRRPIAVEAGGYTFIAPDNGVLSYALSELEITLAVELTNLDYRLAQVSNTFHGRDVFAPAAAHLASGVRLEQLGQPVTDLHRLPMPELIVEDRHIVGEVVHIDRFGNIITSIGQLRWISSDRLTLQPHFADDATPIAIPAENSLITVHNQTIRGISHSYSESERGGLLVTVGSNGHLEIAVNQGNAAAKIDAVIGDRVELKINRG